MWRTTIGISNSHAFGYLGSHSETSWIRDLRKEIDRATPFTEAKAASPGNGSKALTSVSYFLDDQNLLVDQSIAPYDRPSRTTGDRLIHLYFDAVHPSFPIVGRIPFIQQYALYYSRPHMRPPARWLAILNLIFALGAKLRLLLSEPLMDGYRWARGVFFPGSDAQLYGRPDL